MVFLFTLVHLTMDEHATPFSGFFAPTFTRTLVSSLSAVWATFPQSLSTE